MRYLRQHLWRREDLQPLSSAFPVRWHRLDSLPHPEHGMSNYEVFNSVKSSTKCFHKPKDAREGGGRGKQVSHLPFISGAVGAKVPF